MTQSWKNSLRTLEKEEKFDEALLFMGKVIRENPHDVDSYIFMLYFLADLIMEPHTKMVNDQDIRHYCNQTYRALGKKYFHEAYEKFAHHADQNIRCDFLYYVGIIAVFGAQIFDIPEEQAGMMIRTAQLNQPDNPIYHLGDTDNQKIAKQLVDSNSLVRKILSTKGALGEYIVDINQSWAHMTLKKN